MLGARGNVWPFKTWRKSLENGKSRNLRTLNNQHFHSSLCILWITPAVGEQVVIGHGRTLTLRRHEVGRQSVESLAAELTADGLTARTAFWLGPDGVEEGLDEFFASLERDWKGWDGTRLWQGMEGGLSLSCTHDGRGTIRVAVTLEHVSGADWRVQAVLAVDAGEELSGLVRDLSRLLTLTG